MGSRATPVQSQAGLTLGMVTLVNINAERPLQKKIRCAAFHEVALLLQMLQTPQVVGKFGVNGSRNPIDKNKRDTKTKTAKRHETTIKYVEKEST